MFIVDDSSLLIWGLIFGAIGFAFYSYGRKQKTGVPLATGIALIVLPYFVSNVAVLAIVGFALIALPYFFRR